MCLLCEIFIQNYTLKLTMQFICKPLFPFIWRIHLSKVSMCAVYFVALVFTIAYHEVLRNVKRYGCDHAASGTNVDDLLFHAFLSLTEVIRFRWRSWVSVAVRPTIPYNDISRKRNSAFQIINSNYKAARYNCCGSTTMLLLIIIVPSNKKAFVQERDKRQELSYAAWLNASSIGHRQRDRCDKHDTTDICFVIQINRLSYIIHNVNIPLLFNTMFVNTSIHHTVSWTHQQATQPRIRRQTLKTLNMFFITERHLNICFFFSVVLCTVVLIK